MRFNLLLGFESLLATPAAWVWPKFRQIKTRSLTRTCAVLQDRLRPCLAAPELGQRK